MSQNPLNLGLRFALEVVAVIALGMWGASLGDGVFGVILALLLPLLGMTAWGVFATPNDRSRNGQAPIPTPGLIRLLIEFALFGLAVGGLIITNHSTIALIFGLTVVFHYAISYDRIRWLIQQKGTSAR